MEFYKRLQKKALKSRLPLIILFLALAVIFALMSYSSAQNATGEMKNLMDYTGSQLQKYDWYELDTNMVYGGYATDDKGVYYIVRLEQDGTFLGVYASKDDQEKLDRITEQTWNYLSETADAPTERLQGRGKLLGMEAKEKQYFTEFFTDLGVDASQVDMVYYKLDIRSGSTEGVGAVIYGIVAAGALAIALVTLIRFGQKKYRKLVDKTIQERGLNPDFVGEDLAGGMKTANAEIGSHYALLYNTAQVLIDYQDLIWVYKQTNTTQHKIYGIIPAGKTVTHSVVFSLRDKRQLMTNVKKEEQADEVIRYLATQAPYVIYGYSEELATAFKQNFESMVTAVDQRRTTQQ